MGKVLELETCSTHRILLSVQLTLQVQRSTPCVAHKDLAQFAIPSSRRLEELQASNRRTLSWRIRVALHVIRLLETLAPRSVGWILVALLSMLLGVKMNEIIFRCLRKHLAMFAPVKFGIVDDEVDLLFSVKMKL